MTRLSHILIIALSLVLLSTSCGIFKKSKEPVISLKEDFDVFYDRFHKDVDFQMSRIQFPLLGLSVEGNNESEWTKANWPVMKVKIYDIDQTKFIVDFNRTPNTFSQKFKMRNAEFYAEYRFELKGKKWFLVYAKDVNL